jgi:hypothetical protein
LKKIFIPPQVSSESLLPSDYPSKTLFFAVLLQNNILYLKVRFKRTYAATSLLMFKILKHEYSDYGIGLLKPCAQVVLFVTSIRRCREGGSRGVKFKNRTFGHSNISVE